jgi:O-antigen ligase
MRVDTLPQSVMSLPAGLVATRSGRGTVIAYLRALSLTAWFGSLVLNYWWRSDWAAYQELLQSGYNLKEYYYYGFAIFLAAHLTLGVQKCMDAPFSTLATTPTKLLTAFCALMLLLSPLSVAPLPSAIYAVATWITLLLCGMYWKSDYSVVRNVLVFTGLCLFAWLTVLLIHHGQPRGFGTAIGTINRNTTSTLALAACLCCTFANNKTIRWGGMGAAMLFAVAVGSRGSIVATGAFIAVYYILQKGTMKATGHAFFAVLLVGSVLVASAYLQETILEGVFRLHDPTSGLGTGLTGRLEMWKNGIQQFWDSPLIGHGFRTNTFGGLGGIHSGYIQIFAESGAIGGILIISAVCLELRRRVMLAQRFRDMDPSQVPGIDAAETMQLNTVASSLYCAILTLWVFEPLYINLGSCISVLFFLMMAAPSYVSAPIGKRR